jgi:hypothetical protein
MGGYRALGLGILLAFASAGDDVRAAQAVEPAEPVPELRLAGGGMLWLRPNPDALRLLGVRSAGGHASRGLWSLALEPRQPVRVELGDGAPTRFVGGELGIPALRLVHRDGRRTPRLRLQPDGEETLGWRLVDAEGANWLHVTHAMRSPDLVRDGVRLVTADLRVGAALAAWSGEALQGTLFGNVTLHLPLPPADAATAARKAAKSCAAPNWPGTPGFRTDVVLLDMVDVFNGPGISVLRCRTNGTAGCDGPGGQDGEVVYVPSALLSNHTGSDASEVPWYTKFTSPRAPYGNDQHPFLVWNMYRIDADGRLEQIGRSGLKHAFATANTDCIDSTCPFNGNVLGRGCQDIYNSGSNDAGFFLGPRSELIPATGQWGRCGSVFDDTDNNPNDGLAGCDGVQDAPPDDLYRQRLVVREADIEAASNPGATYLMDSWYVVRDDDDIFNTMGHRSLVPSHNGSAWTPGTLGAFRRGSVLDTWLESGPAPWRKALAVLESSEGQVAVATRVIRLPDGRFRYDYALANFDFARAVTDPATSEPNLRVLRTLGLSGAELQLLDGATVDSSEFRDGDATLPNDWVAAPAGADLRWSAPAGATLDWGRQVFLRVVSPSPPATGQMRLLVAEAGAPAQYVLGVPVPDASRVFGDSFE